MLKVFPIDFVRQALEQKLLEQHLDNVNFYGGKNQVSIHSFYEQLKSQEEVDRFVETYRDLSDQQNRTGLILNGVLVSPENPTYTNLYSCTIVPLTWTCSLRCMLENRDNAITTLNNLIEQLKGKKVDIAQLNGVDANGNKISYPFMVGTIGQNQGQPALESGDYIGTLVTGFDVGHAIYELETKNVDTTNAKNKWFYAQNGNKLRVIKSSISNKDIMETYEEPTLVDDHIIEMELGLDGLYSINEIGQITCDVFIYGDDETATLHLTNGVVQSITQTTYTKILVWFVLDQEPVDYVADYVGFNVLDRHVYQTIWQVVEDDGTYDDINFPPAHDSFDKYKLSLSFDAIRCDEPRNLNEREYCELTFGGSATLVNEKVKLGNDLLKVSFSKLKIVASSNITFNNAPTYYLEPLELPSGNNANTQINQLVSNKFKTNSHTDSISITLQYSFILDESIDLLKQWFNYARYGTQGVTVNDISPNMIYTTNEYWCSWGVFESTSVPTKLVENIDIENTESDTLTLGVSMQVQGENN